MLEFVSSKTLLVIVVLLAKSDCLNNTESQDLLNPTAEPVDELPYSECSEDFENGLTLPCSPEEDPWSDTADVVYDLLMDGDGDEPISEATQRLKKSSKKKGKGKGKSKSAGSSTDWAGDLGTVAGVSHSTAELAAAMKEEFEKLAEALNVGEDDGEKSESGSDSDKKPDSKSDTDKRQHSESDKKPDSESDKKPDSKSDKKPDSKSKSKSNSGSGSKSKSSTAKPKPSVAKRAKNIAKKMKKNLKKALDKGLKVLGAIASAAQFIGPIFDLITMFLPASKSAELTAIENGFSETDAALKAMSLKLDQMTDQSDWNAIVSDLIQFEYSVEVGMKKYKALNSFLDGYDTNEELSSQGKSFLEDLINYVRSTGNIGMQLEKLTKLILEGSELMSGGDHLLNIFRRAEKNDCTKILPFAYRLLALIRDAQKLQFIYEMNQGMIDPKDDKGYPRVVYDITVEISEQYADCYKNVLTYAKDDIKTLRDEDKSLDEIIGELGKKYPLYDFSFLEDNDKQNRGLHNYTTASAQIMEVPMDDLSDDDKKKKGLVLYVVPKSDQSTIDAKFLTDKIANSTSFKLTNMPLIPWNSGDYNKMRDQAFLGETFDKFWEKFRAEDPVWWSEIEDSVTVVMYSTNESDITLHGFHTELNLNLMIEWCKLVITRCSEPREHHQIFADNWKKHKYPNSKSGYAYARGLNFGFLFNFEPKDVACVHGTIKYLTFGKNVPFCQCNYGWGGSECDTSLQRENDDSLISSIIAITQEYKIPGMFDLQDQIDDQTDIIVLEMEQNKREIFNEIRGVEAGVQKNRDTILSAQSVILQGLKSETSKVLGEFSNLRTAFEDAMAAERNDRIYRTEKATSVVVNAIVETAQGITDALVDLDKKTVENRYFSELSLHIPVFQRLFIHATMNSSSDGLKEDFVEYLHLHKHYFYVSREAVTHAITGKPDSYLRAQMSGNMVSGCTDEYNDQVKSAWAMLLDLHSSTYVMEQWYLNYRLKDAEWMGDEWEKSTIEDEIAYIDEQSEIESRMFRETYNSSCPSFTMNKIIGGGCQEGLIYRGQTVKLKCTNEDEHVVAKSTGKAIDDLECGENGEWSLDVTDLICAQSCTIDGTKYAIGSTRTLPLPTRGYQWENKDNEAITEITCLYLPDKGKVGWSEHKEVDINECDTVECGPQGNCKNTLGSYDCNCNPGYIENPGKGCEDVNECVAGAIGSRDCLVSQILGVCENTPGSFQCYCLSGSYSQNKKKCIACTCDERGVVKQHCHGKTGKCLCRKRVVGDECSRCQRGYTNFPSCNKCDDGYYGKYVCRRCSKCNPDGTASQICNKRNGDCMCNERSHGEKCDRCCPEKGCEDAYTKFPECTPVPKHGTLSAWSEWGEWKDADSCDDSGKGAIQRERVQTRTCDDTTKNRHGNTCKNDDKVKKQIEMLETCKKVATVSVKISCKSHAGTSGKLRLGIKQGNIECETMVKTFESPDGCKGYERLRYFGCDVPHFDVRKPVDIRLISDSKDDAYVDGFGAIIGDRSATTLYTYETHHKKVDKSEGSEWQTVKPLIVPTSSLDGIWDMFKTLPNLYVKSRNN